MCSTNKNFTIRQEYLPRLQKKNINLNIFSADLVNKSMRLQYFKNIRQIIEKKTKYNFFR